MAYTKNQQTVQDLYGTHLGRQAASGGLDYWSKQLDEGKTVADLVRGIQSGSEYQNRKALIEGAGAAGISEAQLDKSILPGGWKTEHHSGYDSSAGDLFDFNRGNTWATTGFGSDWAKKQNTVNNELGATVANNYGTVAGANTGNYDVGTTHDAAGNPITNNPTDPNDPGYLTSGDLTTWWDALDKPWLNQGTDTGTGSDDQFMKMMMFMAMMRPQGGGYGGSQYGYGGLNPGGVQSAYNPMDNLSGYMDAFKTLPGISSGNISTGTN